MVLKTTARNRGFELIILTGAVRADSRYRIPHAGIDLPYDKAESRRRHGKRLYTMCARNGHAAIELLHRRSVGVELSDEKVLESLLTLWEQDQLGKKSRQRGPHKAPEILAYSPPAEKSFRRPCKCGTCCACVENARWDRIFQQKFADPEYYRRRSIPLLSPLADL
jgi:hypothetical protein